MMVKNGYITTAYVNFYVIPDFIRIDDSFRIQAIRADSKKVVTSGIKDIIEKFDKNLEIIKGKLVEDKINGRNKCFTSLLSKWTS